MTRSHTAAYGISSKYGLRVEYSEANREYVIDGTSAGRTASAAKAMARRISRNQPRSERAYLESLYAD